MMNQLPLFGLSVLMSFVAFGIVTRTYLWPGSEWRVEKKRLSH